MTKGELQTDRLRDKTICVTGARGMIGSRLVRRICELGAAKVIAFDSTPCLADEPTTCPGLLQVSGSVLDVSEIERAVDGCEVVFHLAALTHAGRSVSSPAAYFEVNARGTALLLEVCRTAKVSRFVFASTGHVYGKPIHNPVNEDHPARPLSVYAASKLAGEAIVLGYAAGFGMNCDVARLSNVYGDAGNRDAVVSEAVRQALTSDTIRLRCLSPVRDFIHVDDVSEALVRLALADSVGGGGITNVSVGGAVKIRELAETVADCVARLLGKAAPVVSSTHAEELQVPELVLDNRLLVARTGWRPTIGLEEGLMRTVKEGAALVLGERA